MPSVELLKLIAGLVGVPLLVVLAALLLLIYPQARLVLGDVLRLFGFVGRWARRASLAAEMEGSINTFTKEYNTTVSEAVLPECRVTWVTGENHAQTVTPGSVVVRVSLGPDHDANILNAATTFVRHSLLPRAKAHLAAATATALDLILVRNILRRAKRSALRIFNEQFTSQSEPARNAYYKLEDVDKAGLLNRVLIQEYHYFGEFIGDQAPRPEHQHDADEFLNWLHQLCTKADDERALLSYSSAGFRVGVILVAREETYRTYGLEPYLRRAATYSAEGFRTLYLLSRGRSRGAITKTIAANLCETGGFEALLKRPDVEIGDSRSGEVITCIPLRLDRVALVQAAWDRLQKAKEAGTDVNALITTVDLDAIEVDVYGLRVAVQNPYLAGLEIPDARKYFKRNQEIAIKVVEVDPATNVLVVSNVGTATDPKRIVDAFSESAAEALHARVIGFRGVDGLETGIRIAFEQTPIEGYITRSRACFSRFVALSAKYPISSVIYVRVLSFRSEYNTWTCEITNLVDPWDALSDYREGDLVDVTIREIAERYVICELVEGVEGAVYAHEIAWGNEEERLRAIEGLTPGQNIAARILEFDKTNRTLKLSFKRASQSPMGRHYTEIKGRSVLAEVVELKPNGVVVRFQGTEHNAFLPIRELTWGYCGSVERVVELGQVLAVQAIAYREDWDSITVSAKQSRINEYERCRARLAHGDSVEGTIWACGQDSVFVEIEFDGSTAAAYVHRSEVSNRAYVTPELLPEVLPRKAKFTFEVKRFDDSHRVIEVSRRRWMRTNHWSLNYGDTYRCRAIPIEKGKVLLYGNELEYVGPASGLGSEKEIDVIVTRKGVSDRDLEVEYGREAVPRSAKRKRSGV